MRARSVKLMHHSLQILIKDEQYLFWDNVLTNHYDEVIELYQDLLAQTYLKRRHRCYDPGVLQGRLTLKIGDKRIYAYSFTYLLRASLPLSRLQVIRHSLCNWMKDKIRNTGYLEAISMAILGHGSNKVASN